MSKRKAAETAGTVGAYSANLANVREDQVSLSKTNNHKSPTTTISTKSNKTSKKQNEPNVPLANRTNDEQHQRFIDKRQPSQQIEQLDIENEEPTAFAEKRKRITNTFNELSQIIDFRPSNRNASQSHNDRDRSQTPSSFINELSFSKRLNKENMPRAGIIERVCFKNFKCHSMLEFHLHPYINFILGRNGSGKSAVMDAIILGLGGKAQSTGRQASAKTFIKTNAEKAELSITIKNEGQEAYKMDLYGCRIIVERKITKDGSSQYRLLNENHKLVSNKKTELDNITEKFNIQVENPVCFLNQETSKHFLNSSNKSDKYKLFMKASQLEAMKLLQQQIEHERQASFRLIEEKETFMPKLEQDLYEWEEKFKKCQSVEKLRTKQNALMQEYSWAVVAHWEKMLEAAQKEKRQAEKTREKIEAKWQDAEKKHKEASEEYERVKKSINDLSRELGGMEERGKALNDGFKEAGNAYKTTAVEIKKLQQQIEKKQRSKHELTNKLIEEKKNSQIDYEEERRQKENKIVELKEKLKECVELERFKTQESQRFLTAGEQYDKKMNDLNYAIADNKRLVDNYKADIEKLVQSQKDQICRFGQFMLGLVRDMQQHYDSGRLKQLPKGPIGMYIQPRKLEWSLAIEQCLGGLVTSFICASYEDERVMHQLIAKHVPQVTQRPRVIVADFAASLYDVSQYRPEFREYPTIYEMLHIKDPIVANTLFDQRKIESILLLPDRQTGRQIIEFQSTQTCYEAYLKNGDQLLGKPSYKVYGCRFAQPHYFIENCESVIRAKREEIAKIEQHVQKYRDELENVKQEKANNSKLKYDADKRVESLRRQKYQLEMKLKDAENIKIPEPVDLMVFEEEIQNVSHEIEEAKRRIAQIEENSSELKEQFDAARQRLNEYDNENKQHVEKIQQLKTLYSQLDQDRASNKEALNHYRKCLDEHEPREKEINERIASQEAELARVLKSAEEMCARIETKSSYKKIDSEINEIEKQIQASEKLHGNEQEITKKYLEMSNKYKRIQNDIKIQKKFLSKLKQALEIRQESAKLFTQSKALRCAMDFSNYLNGRNFTGQLKFDHSAETLDIIVHPNNNNNNNKNSNSSISNDEAKCKDLKSLSGGERSFSTVAFLLSLWSIVECPVLFLDEFDVFMDQINRNFAMELILNAAKEKLNGQYVFLTPQEMGSIRPDEYVKMFKMPDPKRAIDQVQSQQEASQ